MRHLKFLFSLAIAFSTVSFAMAQTAADAAGTYKVKLQGNLVKTNQTPVNTPFSGATTMIITETGADEIKLELKGFSSYWSAHIQSGRVGNKRIVTALSNSTKSVYLFTGRFINKNTIQGEFLYLRHGDAGSGIVPGWTRVKLKAVK